MARKSRILKGLNIKSNGHNAENQNVPPQPHVENQNASSQTQTQAENQNASSQPHQVEDDDYTEFINNEGKRYKKRGKTAMPSVWNMDPNERIFVEVDKFGVPCTREGGTLGSFLGTIATNGQLAPLSIPKWNNADFKPFHRKILSIIKDRFLFPPELRKWILKSTNKKWRDYKTDLKAKYYRNGTRPREEIEADVPEDVLPTQWPTLVKIWFSEANQELSKKNTENAKKKKNTHTCGRKSYGIRRKEMAKELGHTPDRLTFYDATHKRKDGTYVDQSTKHCMDAAFSLQVERSLNSSASADEIAEQVFEEVFGKEHNGRVRGLGLGPTPTSYFGSTSYDVGRRWNSSSKSEDFSSLKAELKDLSTRHEDLCGKYEDLNARHAIVCGNYEHLASKHEIISNKYAVVDAFLSQKFPGQWMPNSQENDHRVCDTRERSTSFYNASTHNSSNSLHDVYFS